MNELARLFKALSEETRLEILELIFAVGEVCVCEVEEVLEISQSKASRHLRYLRNQGILVDRRDGLWVHYDLADDLEAESTRILDVLRDVLAARPASPAVARLTARRAAQTPACTVPAGGSAIRPTAGPASGVERAGAGGRG